MTFLTSWCLIIDNYFSWLPSELLMKMEGLSDGQNWSLSWRGSLKDPQFCQHLCVYKPVGVVVLLYTWSQAWITVTAPPLTVKCSLNRCELIVWVLLLGKAADQGARVAASWCNTCLIKLLSEPCTLSGMLTIQLDLSIWKKSPILSSFHSPVGSWSHRAGY